MALPKPERYSAKDVIDHVGRHVLAETAKRLDAPRLQYLVKCGVVQPDYPGAGGRGSFHEFSFRNLVEFLIVQALPGLSTERLRAVVAGMRELDPADWHSNQPAFREAIDRAKRKIKSPTREQVEKWFREIPREKLDLSPEWYARDEMYSDALDREYGHEGPNEHRSSQQDSQPDGLRTWRAFKNPNTRTSDASPVLIVSGAFSSVYFDRAAIAQTVCVAVSCVTVSLRPIFEALERSTDGDYWGRGEPQFGE